MLDSCQLPVGDGEGHVPALRNPSFRTSAFSVRLARLPGSGPIRSVPKERYQGVAIEDPFGFLATIVMSTFSECSPSDERQWCALAMTADSWLSNLHHRLLILVGVLQSSSSTTNPSDERLACWRHVREACRPSASSSDRLRAVVENDAYATVIFTTVDVP